MASNVTLSDQVEAIVDRLVSSGRYANASEAVVDGLRLLEEREDARAVRLSSLRIAIQEGLESGPATPFDMDEIRRKARRRLSGSGR